MSKRVLALFAFAALLAVFGFAVGTAPADSSTPAAGGQAASKPSAAPTASSLYAAGYKASQAGRYEEAIVYFRSAIELKPAYAEAYNMLGFSLRKSGKVDEAFSAYQKALEFKPDFPEAREYYGEAYLMAGDLKDALRQYLILQKAGRAQAKELLAKIDEYLKANPGA